MNYNNIDQGNMIKEIFEKVEGITGNIVHPNIIVCGKTGVGKSTLINNVFREKLAKTGTGSPVTQHLRRIEHPNVPVTLYDTKGLELSQVVQETVRKEIVDLISQSRIAGKPENYIHVIWYCIQSGSNRLEPVEEKMIKELSKSVEIPVIIVMTQCFPNNQTEAFKKSVENMNLPIKNIISVMAQDYSAIPGTIIKAYGLDDLVETTYNVLPEAVQLGFINAQKVNIKAKERTAKKFANAYVVGAFATGFTPMPYSDAPMLVGEQVLLLAHITAIFGLPIDESFLSATVSSLLGSGSATIAGKYIVSNLLKLIPGVGTLAGGVISGSTAAVLTGSIARAYIAIMVIAVKKSNEGKVLDNEEIYQKLSGMFENELKKGSKRV